MRRSVQNPAGFVEISRKRGRIAGFGAPPVSLELIWCGTNRPRKKHGRRQSGWSFPPAVRELLLQECKGKTVVHFFGGEADFGFRLDLDPETNPDVIGDAYLPPFARDSFDVVILDPPYFQMRQQEKVALMRAAAWVAREHIFWFHTVWIATDKHAPLDRAWLIRVGDQCAIRTLQRFKVTEPKFPPMAAEDFTRGHPLIYKRWARRQSRAMELPFPADGRSSNPVCLTAVKTAGVKSGVFTGDWQ